MNYFQYITCPKFISSQEEIDFMEYLIRDSTVDDLQYVLSSNGQKILKFPDASWVKLDGYSYKTKTAYEYYGVSFEGIK